MCSHFCLYIVQWPLQEWCPFLALIQGVVKLFHRLPSAATFLDPSFFFVTWYCEWLSPSLWPVFQLVQGKKNKHNPPVKWYKKLIFLLMGVLRRHKLTPITYGALCMLLEEKKQWCWFTHELWSLCMSLASNQFILSYEVCVWV